MFAAQRGNVQLLRRLVEAGGGAALAMRGGRLLGCPLHFAAEHASLDTVAFIVAQSPAGGRAAGNSGSSLRLCPLLAAAAVVEPCTGGSCLT